MTEAAGFDREPGRPRRVALRSSVAIRLASLAFVVVCAGAAYATAAAHLGKIDALWLAVTVVAALGVCLVRHERRQPALLELTGEAIAAFERCGRARLQGRIVGATQWAERLLVLAVDGADGRRPNVLIVAADSVDAAAFRELAVRGRHAA